MSLNSVPASHRIHIGFFGRTNVGKSSLVNAITSQSLSIVSEEQGTTTDPVQKAMELLPLGPVLIIDTPGLDDDSSLGQKRENRARELFHSIDIGVLVLDINQTHYLTESEKNILEEFSKRKLPFLICINKCDLLTLSSKETISDTDLTEPERLYDCLKNTDLFPYRNEIIFVSAKDGTGIQQCKEHLASFTDKSEPERYFIKDCLNPLEQVILVIPIDHGAPKGRIILPQQQVLRELLEAGIITTIVRETELKDALAQFHPKVVITDSQVFHYVAPIVPEDIYLTSFSILMARYKGTLAQAVEGAGIVDTLPAGARILISEGCTHHRQCDDIGTVKLPRWIREHTGKEFLFDWTSGNTFPEDLSGYQLIIHCGGCMLNEKAMQYRYQHAEESGIPITNYGILIAHLRGILKRSIAILKSELKS